MTYAEIKAGLDSISGMITSNISRHVQIGNVAAVSEAELAGMVAQFGPLVTELDAMLLASPENTALKSAVAEKDLLVAEFQALKTKASAIVVALAGVA